MEIKPQELRLNNLVLEAGVESRIYQIEHRYKENYTVNDLKLSLDEFQKRFKGIELTPEWLERLGMNTPFAPDFMRPLSVDIIQDGKMFTFKTGHWTIRYVHELQNIHYAICGEELAIDKTSLKNDKGN